MVNYYNTWDEKNGHFQMSPNSGFLSKMNNLVNCAGLNKDSIIIVMCRSGDRCACAANLMSKAGYKNMYSVEAGFEGDVEQNGDHKGQRVVNGWKSAGLPWTYKLNKKIRYLN